MVAAVSSVPPHPYKGRLPAPIYWAYRAVRTAGVASCFAAFWSVSVLLAWLWMPVVALWPGSPVDRMRRALAVVRPGFQLFHLMMRVLRLYHRTSPFRVLRPGGVPTETACVVIANHPSLCDTTAFMSWFPNIVAIASSRFVDNPLFGRASRLAGFIPTGAHVLREAEQRLRMGFDVLVFPEGTRSPVGGLHPFHRGAFELAVRAKVPIVLVRLTCEPPALSKRWPIWKVPDHMAVLTMEPFEIIHPTEQATDSRALCRAIEQRYRHVLGYPVAADPASESKVLGDVQ
jgi:1-acyl-sn-glycerol-3-phosphate acyltransferase